MKEINSVGNLVVLVQLDHRDQVQDQAHHQQHQDWDVEVDHLLCSFILLEVWSRYDG